MNVFAPVSSALNPIARVLLVCFNPLGILGCPTLKTINNTNHKLEHLHRGSGSLGTQYHKHLFASPSFRLFNK